MLLSDREIASYIEGGEIGITPFDKSLVQPSSLDMCLGPDFRVMEPGSHPVDTKAVTDYTRLVECDYGQAFVLHPGQFVLAQTKEYIGLPDFITAKLEGKSSLARLGLVLHATAGFIDPGFQGTITLELSLVSPRPLILYPGQKIGQVCFYTMTSPALVPYGTPSLGSKYMNQSEPTASRYVT